jgi:branched-chain amino acid transport system ATP-binding protein
VTDVTSVLSVRNVVKDYGPLRALDDVSLEIPPGTFQGLIGPNGSGKSTLMGIISGANTLTTGSLWLDGKNITRLPPYKRARRGIAMKFQITAVFPQLAVCDNLLLALQTHSGFGSLMRSRTRAALLPRIDEFLNLAYLEEVAHTEAGILSHGEQQRLEIAMALAADPTLLLLDEPTAGMSPEERRLMGELLRDIAPGRTIVIVEHDLGFVKRLCSSIAVLDHGRLVASGPPAKLEQDETVRTIYLGRDVAPEPAGC